MPYEIRAMQAVRQRIKQAATPIHIPPGPGRLTSKTKIRYKFSRSGKKEYFGAGRYRMPVTARGRLPVRVGDWCRLAGAG